MHFEYLVPMVNAGSSVAIPPRPSLCGLNGEITVFAEGKWGRCGVYFGLPFVKDIYESYGGEGQMFLSSARLLEILGVIFLEAFRLSAISWFLSCIGFKSILFTESNQIYEELSPKA